MAEHKADTYNMFKTLVKQFPEYNEIFIAKEENISPSRTQSRNTDHVEKVEIKFLKQT